MNTAEFKTLREAMGLLAKEVAEANGVVLRTAQRWEEPGKVDPDIEAQKWIRGQWENFVSMVREILARVEEMNASQKNKSMGITLARYVDDESAKAGGENRLSAL